MIAVSLGPVAVARQRAGLLLGLGGRRYRRHPQLYGGEKPRHRRRHRGPAAGARAERIRLHGARTRPNPDIRVLRRAALSSAGTMGRPLPRPSNIPRPPRCSAICRKPGGAHPEAVMILGDSGQRRRRCRHHARRYPAPECRAPAGRHRAHRSAQPRGLHRRRTAPASPMRKSTAWSRPSRSACATSDCRRTSIVATQFPNTSESVLALLGIMRAGMIAAPMPMLWRHADCVAALSRIGTKALMTCARIGTTDHATLAMQVAAAIFTVRCVCGFGPMPDGACRSTTFSNRSNPARTFRSRPIAATIRPCISRRLHSIRRRTASCRSRAVTPSCWRAACRCSLKAVSRRIRTSLSSHARGLLRRHCTDIGAVAAVRRNAAAASAIRCHRLVRAIEGTVLRSRDPARIAGRAARGSGHLRAAAPPEKYSGLLARARAAAARAGLADAACEPDRCRDLRRNRALRRASPRRQTCAHSRPARSVRRKARRGR